MARKPGDRSIGGVKGTTRAKSVEDAQEVSRVGHVKAATGVSKLGGVGGIGRRLPTRTLSLAERDELFKMIDEEAEKIFGAGTLSTERKAVVQQAVKMAVDSALVESAGGSEDE